MWVDIFGVLGSGTDINPPDNLANFADLDFLVKAFAVRAYEFDDPANCPDAASWPGTAKLEKRS